MCDKKKTWLVIDYDGDSHVCTNVKQLEELVFVNCKKSVGTAYDIGLFIDALPDEEDWKVYEISGSEAKEIDISFKMKLSIRL